MGVAVNRCHFRIDVTADIARDGRRGRVDIGLGDRRDSAWPDAVKKHHFVTPIPVHITNYGCIFIIARDGEQLIVWKQRIENGIVMDPNAPGYIIVQTLDLKVIGGSTGFGRGHDYGPLTDLCSRGRAQIDPPFAI